MDEDLDAGTPVCSVRLPDAVATSAADARGGAVRAAAARAHSLGLPFTPRNGRPLAQLWEETECRHIAVLPRRGPPRLHGRGWSAPLVYHPGMAFVRVKRLLNGEGDKLVDFAGVRAGDRVLDCTAGLGADAAVFSFAAGPRGGVAALEVSAPLAWTLFAGARVYSSGMPEFDRALRRICVDCARFQERLANAPADAYDIVYLDPMFERFIPTEGGIGRLRPFAEHAWPTRRDIEAALLAARRKVVVKGRRRSELWERLGIQELDGGTGDTAYGRMDAKEWKRTER